MSYQFGFSPDRLRNPPGGSGPLCCFDEVIALAVRYMLLPRSIGYGPLALHQADGYIAVLLNGAPAVIMHAEAWRALVDKFYPVDKDGYSYITVSSPPPAVAA